MLFPEKCFNFGEKYHISGKVYGISGKILSYLGKMEIPEKFFDSQTGTLTENFLATGGGRSPKKIFLSALFLFEKCPSKPGPPTFRSFLRPWDWIICT
jgi:hypothetical protein